MRYNHLMDKSIEQSIQNLMTTAKTQGETALLIIESLKDKAELVKALKIAVSDGGYRPAIDHLSLMDSLESSTPVLYVESSDSLDSKIFEIIKEFNGGIVTFMETREAREKGLRTVLFDPKKSPLLIVLTRAQVEASEPGLFEYAGPIETVTV